MREREFFVGSGAVRVNGGAGGGVLDDAALERELVGILDHLGGTRFVARSFTPTTATLPKVPRPTSAAASVLRLALDMFLRFPRK